MRIGDDRYFDPAQLAIGYARAAAARGATLFAENRRTRREHQGRQSHRRDDCERHN
jgi:glycine/D-amino acid oxidase-like deaminating enzyme